MRKRSKGRSLITRIQNYLFYRSLGHGVTASWAKAGSTI